MRTVAKKPSLVCKCGAAKTARAKECRECWKAKRRDAAIGPHRTGEPGYGSTCPTCGGRKDPRAEQCGTCSGYGEGLYTTGRNEAIVTFRSTRTGQVRTVHCIASGAKAQIATGIAQIADDEQSAEDWVVECRSTPDSILDDLTGRRDARGEWRGAR